MVAAGVLAALVAAPTDDPVAAPLPADYALTWTAPPGCPDAATIRAKVDGWLAGRVGGEGTMLVEASVAHTQDRWDMEVRTEFAGSTDSRRIAARSCAELGDSLALVVALALEPLLLGNAAVPENNHAVPLQAPVKSLPKLGSVAEAHPHDHRIARTGTREFSPTRARADPYRAHRPRAGMRLQAGLEYGAVPGVAPYLAASFAAIWPRWQVEFSGGWIGPRQRTSMGTSVRVQLGVVGARGCALPTLGRWQIPVCVGLESGVERLRGESSQRLRVTHGPWLAPAAAAAAARSWGRLGVWIEGQVAIRAIGTRARFGDAVLFSSARASLRFVAGLTLCLHRYRVCLR